MSFDVSTCKAAIKWSEAVQYKHRKLGASDTEPDGLFQACVVRVLDGNAANIPRSGRAWSLFSGMPGIQAAAQELSDKTQNVVDAIKKVKNF